MKEKKEITQVIIKQRNDYQNKIELKNITFQIMTFNSFNSKTISQWRETSDLTRLLI
jgi:hypothetical protein